MKTSIFIVLIFFIVISSAFAEEPQVYTDSDLQPYKYRGDDSTYRYNQKILENNRKQEEYQQQQEKYQQSQDESRAKQQVQEKPKVEEELNCYSFQPPSSPYTWEHCRNKSGKLVSKRRI